MTTSLEQLAGTLPNGFHDALISTCKLDFVGRIAEFDLEVSVGDPNGVKADPDAYRAATLTVTGLSFCQIEPPDPRYPFTAAEPVMVDLCDADSTHPLAGTIPADAFFSRFFVSDWNAFIHIAASDATLTWR
jgi:hypothetical protein